MRYYVSNTYITIETLTDGFPFTSLSLSRLSLKRPVGFFEIGIIYTDQLGF